MITHVPGPFEMLIRRLKARLRQKIDGICAAEPAKRQVAKSPLIHLTDPPVAQQQEAPVNADDPPLAQPVESGVDHDMGRVVAHQPPAALVEHIARAIQDGRATGSQREIAKAFNVSRATVQRAQKMVREAA